MERAADAAAAGGDGGSADAAFAGAAPPRRCESCAGPHAGSYGSGRFCCATCAKQVGARCKWSAARVAAAVAVCAGVCESCGRPHGGAYGSGRFCSVQCARRVAAESKWARAREDRVRRLDAIVPGGKRRREDGYLPPEEAPVHYRCLREWRVLGAGVADAQLVHASQSRVVPAPPQVFQAGPGLPGYRVLTPRVRALGAPPYLPRVAPILPLPVHPPFVAHVVPLPQWPPAGAYVLAPQPVPPLPPLTPLTPLPSLPSLPSLAPVPPVPSPSPPVSPSPSPPPLSRAPPPLSRAPPPCRDEPPIDAPAASEPRDAAGRRSESAAEALLCLRSNSPH